VADIPIIGEETLRQRVAKVEEKQQEMEHAFEGVDLYIRKSAKIIVKLCELAGIDPEEVGA
jgi:hypothetical protein